MKETKGSTLKKIFLIALISKLSKLAEVVRYYNLGLIYRYENRVVENEFSFIRRLGDHFTNWKNYHPALQAKALNPISYRVLPIDRSIASIALTAEVGEYQIDSFVFFGYRFNSANNTNQTVLSVVDSENFGILKEVVLESDRKLELCSQFLKGSDQEGTVDLKIACIDQESEQTVELFVLSAKDLKLERYSMKSPIRQLCSLEVNNLYKIRESRVSVYERCPVNARNQSNIVFFFDISGLEKHKEFVLNEKMTGLQEFNSIGMVREGYKSIVLISGFMVTKQTGQKQLALRRCFIDLNSPIMPISECTSRNIPYFHSNGFSRIVNGVSSDYLVYIVYRGVDQVEIGKCRLNTILLECTESPFPYMNGVGIVNLGVNVKNFVTYQVVDILNPDTIFHIGAYDDQKLDVQGVSHQSDSIFRWNEIYYVTFENVLKVFNRPDYGLQISAERLKMGENKLKIQINKGPNLYILTYLVTLTDILYDEFELEANYFVKWEDEYDLTVPISRNLVLGNGLEFSIDEEMKDKPIILDKSTVKLEYDNKELYREIYFFGYYMVGILKQEAHSKTQGVTIFSCFRISFELTYKCEAITTTHECLPNLILYKFQPLHDSIIAMRFISKDFDEETNLFFDGKSYLLKSYNQTIYEDEALGTKAEQNYDEMDYVIGSNFIYFVRNYRNNRTVLVKRTPVNLKDQLVELVSNKTQFQREGDFCPESVSFDYSGIPSYQIMSTCNDIVLLASINLFPSRFTSQIVGLSPAFIKDSFIAKKRMCKGLTVNPLWTSNTNIIYSIDMKGGGSTNYRIPSDVNLLSIVCVPNSDRVIVVGNMKTKSDSYLIMIYSTNPQESRKKLLVNTISFKAASTPDIMATQINTVIYISIQDIDKGVSTNYLVYRNGPYILIPKQSLVGKSKIALRINNWRKSHEYAFKLVRYKDDSPSLRKKVYVEPKNRLINLEGAFSGNILNFSLNENNEDIRLQPRLKFVGNYPFQDKGDNLIGLQIGSNYTVSMRYLDMDSTFNLTSKENKPIFLHKVMAICKGLDSNLVNGYLVIVSICIIEDRTQLVIIHYDFADNSGVNQPHVSKYVVSEQFDSLQIMHFRTTYENQMNYAIMLQEKTAQFAHLGIYSYQPEDQIGSLKIIHKFQKSKK